MTRFDRAAFFAASRKTVFGGRLTQIQVDGCNALLEAFDRLWSTVDPSWVAYALATACHETAATMQPIRERGSAKYLEALYGPSGKNPARARRNGNTAPGDGVRYCGRGYVQLTWRNNYAAMGRHLSALHGAPVDLVSDPDLAMRPDYAAEILCHGMATGAFTGVGLGRFLGADRRDWIGARRVINGTDRAAHIATIATNFLSALEPR